MNFSFKKKPQNFYSQNSDKCYEMIYSLIGVTGKQRKEIELTKYNQDGTKKAFKDSLNKYWDKFDSFANLYNGAVSKNTEETTGTPSDPENDLKEADLKLFYNSSKEAIKKTFKSDIGEEFYNSLQKMNKDEFQQAQENLLDLLISNQREVKESDRFNSRIVSYQGADKSKSSAGLLLASGVAVSVSIAALVVTAGTPLIVGGAAFTGVTAIGSAINIGKRNIANKYVTKINPSKLVNLESGGLCARHEDVLTKYEGRSYKEVVFDVTTGKEPSKYRKEMQNKEQDQTSVMSSLNGESIHNLESSKFVHKTQRGGDGDQKQKQQSDKFLDALKNSQKNEHGMC